MFHHGLFLLQDLDRQADQKTGLVRTAVQAGRQRRVDQGLQGFGFTELMQAQPVGRFDVFVGILTNDIGQALKGDFSRPLGSALPSEAKAQGVGLFDFT